MHMHTCAGMALRGADPTAVHKAINGMRDEFEKIVLTFHMSIHTFLWVVVVAYAWSAALTHWTSSTFLSCLSIGMSVGILRYTSAIEVSFIRVSFIRVSFIRCELD